MNEDSKQLIIGCAAFLTFTLIICSAIMGGCREVEKTNQEAIKAGLCQKQFGNTAIWVRPEKE